MEILKSFILFGIIEVFIVLYFMKVVWKIDKVKYWHMLILCPLYLFCGYLNIPYIKQTSVFIICIVYLFILTRDFKNSIKYSVIPILYLLVVEATFLLPIDLIGIIDVTKINDYLTKFLLFIPIRLLQIIIIKYIQKRC